MNPEPQWAALAVGTGAVLFKMSVAFFFFFAFLCICLLRSLALRMCGGCSVASVH